MRVSVAWLCELLPAIVDALGVPRGEPLARAIAARLTGVGLEVESITPFGAGLDRVVVAEVVAVRPHPSKSGLRLVTVSRGSAQQEVVCGAPNVPPPGGRVALALLGAHLPAAANGAGLTIAPRAIGGVESEGMLCSERELGLAFGQKIGAGKAGGDDSNEGHDGILILPADLGVPGAPLSEVIGSAHDWIFELGVTPNRPDALGHVGVARDLAAAVGLAFALPAVVSGGEVASTSTEALLSVSIDPAAAARCTEYRATVVLGAKIAPSSLATRYRLHALGVRSISNVVDVTNLLMLKYGQPLHAFDLDRLAGAKINVRLATDGETLRTLDGQTRALVADDLLICDGAGERGAPTALAGVMGGGDSEIVPETGRIAIECAYFDPRSVRRTARRHGMHTESSHRFERGVDPGLVAHVSAEATAMIAAASGGTPSRGVIRVGRGVPERARIRLRFGRIDALLGDVVPVGEARAILTRLGCELIGEGAEIEVLAPTHRPDLLREVDLIEEVARIRGIDRIPTIRPAVAAQPLRRAGSFERAARQAAASLGLFEAVNLSFASVRDLAAVGAPEASVVLANPLGEERAVMRTSLLPGLLHALRRSRNRGERRVRLFEVGARFLPGGPEADAGLCDEVSSFAAVLAGPRDAWLGRGDELDAFDAKGFAEALVEALVRVAPRCDAYPEGARPKHLHPRSAGRVRLGEGAAAVTVGSFGALHPDVIDAFALESSALVLELDLRAIAAFGVVAPKFVPLPAMQATFRDVALEADDGASAASLVEALAAGAGPICARIELFDLYRGKGVTAGRKSMAFRLTYRDPADERTLTDAEVDAAHGAAIKAVANLGATPRG